MLDGFTGPGRVVRYFTYAATLSWEGTKAPHPSQSAPGGIRTHTRRIKSPLLCLWSYKRKRVEKQATYWANQASELLSGCRGIRTPNVSMSRFYRPLASPVCIDTQEMPSSNWNWAVSVHTFGPAGIQLKHGPITARHG